MVRRYKNHCPSFFSIEFIVLAAMTIANIVRTSLGPLGLDKMLVDDIGVNEIYLQYKSNSMKSNLGCNDYK